MDWGDPKPSPQWDWEHHLEHMIYLPPTPAELWRTEDGVRYSPEEVRRAGPSSPVQVEESSRGSSDAVVSVCSVTGEPPPTIGLQLGRGIDFEDLDGTALGSSGRSEEAAGRRKGRGLHAVVRCQVEGCNLDLKGAKEYHRKHKVCDVHSKSPRVVVAGRERRFCQQCSRFHDLSEFDQKKRSCRRRLSDHNARRRKPPPEMISFSSARSHPSLYDDAHRMTFLWNKNPCSYPASNSSSLFWIPGAREHSLRSTKPRDSGGEQRWFPADEPSSLFPTFQHEFSRHLSPKGTATDILSKGLEATTAASRVKGASDIRRALSLLSNESWGSTSSEPVTFLNQIVHTSHPTADFPGLSPNLDDWVGELSLTCQNRKLPFALYGEGSQHQELHPLKPPHETVSFDPGHLHVSSE